MGRLDGPEGKMETVSGARAELDLSADLGELDGDVGRQLDRALVELVTTAHVATGGHAGDPATMRAVAAACAASGTRLGAHPSYRDREGFGRRRIETEPTAVADAVLEQLDLLEELARAEGIEVVSVKPHGALYHDLSSDEALAEAVLGALAARREVVVLAAGSRAAAHAELLGLRVVAEGFCDRRYGADGELLGREQDGALLEEPSAAAAQAVVLARRGLERRGRRFDLDSLCVHSDAPGVLEILTAVRAALDAEGVLVAAPGR